MEITYTQALVVVTCWCGIEHAIPSALNEHLKESNEAKCYCPLGHVWVRRKGYREKLQEAEEQLARERRRISATQDLLRAEERSHAATRGHLTRTKNRVAHGVCPHCNRTFQNLQRHMASKHAEEVTS